MSCLTCSCLEALITSQANKTRILSEYLYSNLGGSSSESWHPKSISISSKPSMRVKSRRTLSRRTVLSLQEHLLVPNLAEVIFPGRLKRRMAPVLISLSVVLTGRTKLRYLRQGTPRSHTRIEDLETLPTGLAIPCKGWAEVVVRRVTWRWT